MIKIEKANLKFNDKTIFNDLNFNINKGEKVIIRAHSGRGKSTLLKVIMGFQKLTSGKVEVDGLELNISNIEKIREKISYLPQSINFRNQTIKEVIENIFSFKKNRSLKVDNEKLMFLIEELKLEKDILEKNFDFLSGGEKQRVALIIAFLMNKEIILLDESIASLDVVLKERVMRYLLQLDKTVILVTHDRGVNVEGYKVMEI
ncbi:MAG: ABC transporter ATP-binding protein [Fusobacteriaceae bacterium]